MATPIAIMAASVLSAVSATLAKGAVTLLIPSVNELKSLPMADTTLPTPVSFAPKITSIDLLTSAIVVHL